MTNLMALSKVNQLLCYLSRGNANPNYITTYYVVEKEKIANRNAKQT